MNIQEEIDRRFMEQVEYGGTHKPVNKIQPLVSISVSTSPQKDYIQQNLEGLLGQKTNFPFEIIIGEVGLPNEEIREIYKTYAKKYPHKIRLLLRNAEPQYQGKNKYIIRQINGVVGLNRLLAKGQYMAICEGSDYWTNPLKLQKQVDFMNRNRDCGMCFHAISTVPTKNQKTSHFYGIKTESNLKYSSEAFIKNKFAHSVSYLFRRAVVKDYPEWAYLSPTSEYPLQMICAAHGNIGYLGGPSMAVQRSGLQESEKHEEFQSEEEKKEWLLECLDNFNRVRDQFNTYSDHKYNPIIEEQKRTFNLRFLLKIQNNFKRKEIIALYRKYIKRSSKWDQQARLFWSRFFLGKKMYTFLINKK